MSPAQGDLEDTQCKDEGLATVSVAGEVPSRSGLAQPLQPEPL